MNILDQIYSHQPYIAWSTEPPEGRILLSTFSTIWRELPNASPEKLSILTSGFLGLLNGFLTPQFDSLKDLHHQQATVRAMKDYLLNNLQKLDLDAVHLCQKFNYSRAQVYRLFQNVGGVKAYLRNQRLKFCFQELEAVNDNSSTRVSDIANKYGFYNVAYFSRLFKKQYGISPSDLRDLSLKLNRIQNRKEQNKYEDEIDTFRSWLELN